MAEFKTSFIPQKPLVREGAPRPHAGVNIVLLVSFIVFFAVVAAAGGVFLYGILMNRQEENLAASINRAREAIEPELVASLGRIDARINAVKTLLDNHTAVSPIFGLLEQLTLESVAFENFRYAVDQDGKINLQLSGSARSYSSVALQSVLFGENRFIENPIFSNLQLNNQGNVTFNFSARINKRLVLYENSAAGAVSQSF